MGGGGRTDAGGPRAEAGGGRAPRRSVGRPRGARGYLRAEPGAGGRVSGGRLNPTDARVPGGAHPLKVPNTFSGACPLKVTAGCSISACATCCAKTHARVRRVFFSFSPLRRDISSSCLLRSCS